MSFVVREDKVVTHPVAAGSGSQTISNSNPSLGDGAPSSGSGFNGFGEGRHRAASRSKQYLQHQLISIKMSQFKDAGQEKSRKSRDVSYSAITKSVKSTGQTRTFLAVAWSGISLRGGNRVLHEYSHRRIIHWIQWRFDLYNYERTHLKLKRVPHPATKLDDITVSGKIFDKRDKVNGTVEIIFELGKAVELFCCVPEFELYSMRVSGIKEGAVITWLSILLRLRGLLQVYFNEQAQVVLGKAIQVGEFTAESLVWQRFHSASLNIDEAR
ncbi:hypothetical protein EDD18DRAFT_1110077 [Armillaria luteobubalina]|uniref:Uncharacterized protein n=1 Tax=Armillaria luteobubalina TaxID=153913 RepID=A0AA39UJ23_9AGAR|nr:hypothetical protein EDD18DRAFT_1110077 [Armillaria luteobubalina]